MMRINYFFLTLIFLILSSSIDARVLHSEKSLYRNILVQEKSGKRCMVFGRMSRNPTLQTCMYTKKPEQLVFSYTKYLLAGFTQIKQTPKSILVIGLGGGTLPMHLERLYPGTKIDSVEIDPAVVAVAKRWFNYKESDNQKAHTVDGRVFVKRQKLKNIQYDVIILDAFNGDYIPEHMMTVEYFSELKSLLSPEGLLIANTFSTNKLFDHESTTYQKVFGDFYYLHSDLSGNRIIYANLKQINRYESFAETQKLKDELGKIGVDFYKFNALITNKVDWDTDARLLTDQFSPANLLKF